MSARVKARGVAGTWRVLALGCALATSFFGCSSIIGLGDYTVAGNSGGHAGTAAGGEAGQGLGNEAGEGGTGNAQSGGGSGNAPAVVGCDGKTGFTPNENIVRSCLLRAGCDPTFDPVRTVSQCVTFDTQAALPGESCNLSSKTCADYESCEHVGVAHDDLCGGTKTTRCENGKAINCGNYNGDDRFFDCTALGGNCGTYTYTNNTLYADCTLDVAPDSCVGQPDDDGSYFCHSGGATSDDLRYYCWGGQAFGTTCTSLAKCQDDAVSASTGDGGAGGTVTSGGDATCFFNLPHCTTPVVPTCNNGVANDCSEGSLFKYDCSAVGLGCNISSETEYCLAPGCKPADIDTNCVESCSDDGTQLTFCYGGAPYTVTCSDYGFTQCLTGMDDTGNTFAACRF